MMTHAVRFGLVLICLLALNYVDETVAADKARQAYDQMVEEAKRESEAYLKEKEQADKEMQEAAQAQQDAVLEERMQAEQARIQAQMDAIRGRGLSSTYTQGMRDNQLQQLQDKLDRLMSDPEAYFGQQ
jgi:hypothetical protein